MDLTSQLRAYPITKPTCELALDKTGPIIGGHSNHGRYNNAWNSPTVLQLAHNDRAIGSRVTLGEKDQGYRRSYI